MSNEKKETLSDIVAEIRRDRPAWPFDSARNRGGGWVYAKWGTFEKLADRIEAAAERHCSECVWYHIYKNGLDEMREENARLRTALIPVMEVDCQLDNYPTKDAFMAALEIVVSDAQRIYNGS